MKMIIKNLWILLLVAVFVFLAHLSIWAVTEIGDIEFDKIVFHMFMPMKQAHTDWMKGIYLPFYLTILNFLVILYIWRYLSDRFSQKSNRVLIIFLILYIIFDVWYANKHFYVFNFIKSQIQSSVFIEQHYVNPKTQQIVFPKNKKNLIILMVESLETSYQDKENGGLFSINHIPELTQIAKENISFSHSDKIEGAIVPPETGWTIAATVAQTAGIPLKLYGSTHTNNKPRDSDDSMDSYKYFLPNVITLGDILYANGYHNYAILGTNSRYAGKLDYLTQHGRYIVTDNISENSKKIIQDEELFQIAKQKLSTLSEQKPFSLLIQTIDTHFASSSDFDKISKEVANFITWIQNQSFFENTLVVVVGDHCNMNQTDFNKIEQEDFRYGGNIKRKVYNVFINSSVVPQKMKYRQFSTFDMFPTILAALGVKIEKNKLGLGVNLFSNEKTLMEQFEPTFVFEELRKKSHFYNRRLLYK